VTLADLPTAFAAARTAASAGKPVVEDIPPGTCWYCGGYLRTWPSSRNDGHAVCIVSLDFQQAVDALWRSDPRLTLQQIADVCGVTLNTVTRWIRNVERQA